jgi:hypothetical protein
MGPSRLLAEVSRRWFPEHLLGIERNCRSLGYAPPDFLWNLLALAYLMRLSLRERRTRDLVQRCVAGNPGRDDKGKGNGSIESRCLTEALFQISGFLSHNAIPKEATLSPLSSRGADLPAASQEWNERVDIEPLPTHERSCFVSGHDFSRAAHQPSTMGFSPCSYLEHILFIRSVPGFPTSPLSPAPLMWFSLKRTTCSWPKPQVSTGNLGEPRDLQFSFPLT